MLTFSYLQFYFIYDLDYFAYMKEKKTRKKIPQQSFFVLSEYFSEEHM